MNSTIKNFLFSQFLIQNIFLASCSSPKESAASTRTPLIPSNITNKNNDESSTEDSSQTSIISIPLPSDNPVENLQNIQKALNKALDSPSSRVHVVFPEHQNYEILENSYQEVMGLEPVLRHEVYCNFEGTTLPVLQMDLDRNQVLSKQIILEANGTHLVYAGFPEYCDVAKHRPILFLKSEKDRDERTLRSLRIQDLDFDWKYPPFLQGLIAEVGPSPTENSDSYVDIQLTEGQSLEGLFPGKKIARMKTYLRSSKSLAPNILILKGKASNSSQNPSELKISQVGVNGDERRIRLRIPKRSLWHGNNKKVDCYPERVDEPQYDGVFNCEKSRLGLEADGEMGILIDQMIFERPTILSFGFTDLEIENVGIHQSGSTGLNLSDGKNIIVNALKVIPPEGSDLILSSVADAINFGEVSGTISIQNSEFVGLGDDAINVHGQYQRVERVGNLGESNGSVRTIVCSVFNLNKGAAKASSGQRIDFYNGETAKHLGYGIIESVDRIRQSENPDHYCYQDGGVANYAIFVSSPSIVASDLREGDPYLEIEKTNSQDLVIKGNRFKQIRGRAVVSQVKNAKILDNLFENISSAAVMVTSDFYPYLSSTAARSVEISSNRVKNAPLLNVLRERAAAFIINVKAEGNLSSDYNFHRDLVFKNNLVEMPCPDFVGESYSRNRFVDISNAYTLTLLNNALTISSDCRSNTQEYPDINTNNFLRANDVGVVDLGGNTMIDRLLNLNP